MAEDTYSNVFSPLTPEASSLLNEWESQVFDLLLGQATSLWFVGAAVCCNDCHYNTQVNIDTRCSIREPHDKPADLMKSDAVPPLAVFFLLCSEVPV